ncbi:hypothetical protein, partial [Streptococcus pneumoniae]|uniref:hypothetical protein n=1 Tax=Streptococcus pneumoniae TaxID=1313 RepID=UPI00125BA5D5
MDQQLNQSNKRERITGQLIGYSSLVFCILLIIHNFIALDARTAKTLLTLAHQKASSSAELKMDQQLNQSNKRERITGQLIGYSSLVFCIL